MKKPTYHLELPPKEELYKTLKFTKERDEDFITVKNKKYYFKNRILLIITNKFVSLQ